MSIIWKQLPAFAMAQQHSEDLVMRLLGAEAIEDKAAYMDEYQRKPIDMQCALGFMRCLIESSFAEPYSAYGRYCMELFERRRVPPMRLPLSFIGWAFLCLLTLGIGYIWLYPYIQASEAAFYEEVKADYELNGGLA